MPVLLVGANFLIIYHDIPKIMGNVSLMYMDTDIYHVFTSFSNQIIYLGEAQGAHPPFLASLLLLLM